MHIPPIDGAPLPQRLLQVPLIKSGACPVGHGFFDCGALGVGVCVGPRIGGRPGTVGKQTPAAGGDPLVQRAAHR